MRGRTVLRSSPCMWQWLSRVHPTVLWQLKHQPITLHSNRPTRTNCSFFLRCWHYLISKSKIGLKWSTKLGRSIWRMYCPVVPSQTCQPHLEKYWSSRWMTLRNKHLPGFRTQSVLAAMKALSEGRAGGKGGSAEEEPAVDHFAVSHDPAEETSVPDGSSVEAAPVKVKKTQLKGILNFFTRARRAVFTM